MPSLNDGRRGFTLIELLVVAAIIGPLSTLAVVALNGARQKSRDAKRIADIRQIQEALELYFSDHDAYPVGDGLILGEPGQLVLAGGGFKAAADAGDQVYMGQVPAAPVPNDGSCTVNQNRYSYGSTSPNSYLIYFCLGNRVGDLAAGNRQATQDGVK